MKKLIKCINNADVPLILGWIYAALELDNGFYDINGYHFLKDHFEVVEQRITATGIVSGINTTEDNFIKFTTDGKEKLQPSGYEVDMFIKSNDHSDLIVKLSGMAMQGIIQTGLIGDDYIDEICTNAVKVAEEMVKQLKEKGYLKTTKQ